MHKFHATATPDTEVRKRVEAVAKLDNLRQQWDDGAAHERCEGAARGGPGPADGLRIEPEDQAGRGDQYRQDSNATRRTSANKTATIG